MIYTSCGKRIFDVCVSALLLLMLAPLFFLVIVLLMSGRDTPVFFCQIRVGRHFRPFVLYKFATMHRGSETLGPLFTAKNDGRITPIGRFLRKTKIDELPQLINVLIGDMSLVGPRPEVPAYVQMLSDDYKFVLEVRPGITDYAAIEYRNEESVLARYTNPKEAYIQEILPAKISLYKRYIAEQSIGTDLKILSRTILALFHL